MSGAVALGLMVIAQAGFANTAGSHLIGEVCIHMRKPSGATAVSYHWRTAKWPVGDATLKNTG